MARLKYRTVVIEYKKALDLITLISTGFDHFETVVMKEKNRFSENFMFIRDFWSLLERVHIVIRDFLVPNYTEKKSCWKGYFNVIETLIFDSREHCEWDPCNWLPLCLILPLNSCEFRFLGTTSWNLPLRPRCQRKVVVCFLVGIRYFWGVARSSLCHIPELLLKENWFLSIRCFASKKDKQIEKKTHFHIYNVKNTEKYVEVYFHATQRVLAFTLWYSRASERTEHQVGRKLYACTMLLVQ